MPEAETINSYESQPSPYQIDDEDQHSGKKEEETPFGEIEGDSRDDVLKKIGANFQHQLEKCKKWRKIYFDDMWELCDKAFYGFKESLNSKDVEKEYRSNIRIRYAYEKTDSQTAKVVNSILGFNPPVSVMPNDSNSHIKELKAKAAQKKLKYNFFQRQNAFDLVYNWIHQGERLGLSPLKLHWAYKKKKKKSIRRPAIDSNGSIIGLTKKQFSDYTYVVKDNPENCNVSTRMFWWNPDAVNIEGIRYVYEQYYVPISHIKNSPLYIKGQVEKVQPESYIGDEFDVNERADGQSMKFNTGEDMVTLTERWDSDYLITMAGDQVIRFRDNPFDDGIIPYYLYRASPLDDQIVGMGTIEPMLDLEELANTIINQRLDNVHRIINRMLLVSSSSGLKKKRIRFRPGGVETCLDPQKVQPFPMEDVTQSAYIEQSEAERRMDAMAKDPAVTRGQLPSGGRETATSIQTRVSGSGMGIEMKIWHAQGTLAEIFRDMYRLEKQFGNPKEAYSIVGSEGATYNFKHNELFVDDFEFDYTLGGYMGNRMADFQQFIQGLSAAQNIPGLLQQFNLKELARIFVERSNIRGEERLLSKEGMMEEGYYRDPTDENKRMLYFGEPIEVLPGERHTHHVPIHMKLRDVSGLPEEIKKVLSEHIAMHKESYISQMQGGESGEQITQLQRMIGQLGGAPSKPAQQDLQGRQAVNSEGAVTRGGPNAGF